MSSNKDNSQPQDNEFEGQMEFMKQAIDNSLQEGNKFILREEYESAIEQFSAAVQVSEMLYGENHINGAFPTYKYGFSLFKSAVANRRALDLDTANDAHEDEEMEEQAKTNLQASSSNIQIDAAEDLDQIEDEDEGEGEGDEVDDQEGEDGEGEDDGEEAGDVDDLSLSYHVLSGALNLYKTELQKDPKNTTLRDQMCQVYITMGDASLESENFELAVENYKGAEANIREYFGDQLRRLSEVLYLLAMAYEYQVDYQKSQQVFEEVKALLTKRKSELDLEKSADKEEAKDLDQLIKEVSERIQDAVMTENLSSVIADALQKQNEKETVKFDPELIAKAKDVSSLIKRKRKDEEESNSNNKESKTE